MATSPQKLYPESLHLPITFIPNSHHTQHSIFRNTSPTFIMDDRLLSDPSTRADTPILSSTEHWHSTQAHRLKFAQCGGACYPHPTNIPSTPPSIILHLPPLLHPHTTPPPQTSHNITHDITFQIPRTMQGEHVQHKIHLATSLLIHNSPTRIIPTPSHPKLHTQVCL